MGALVSGMGVGYLSKRWKRSSSDGSMGSGTWSVMVARVFEEWRRNVWSWIFRVKQANQSVWCEFTRRGKINAKKIHTNTANDTGGWE